MANTATTVTGDWDVLFIEFVEDVARNWLAFWQQTESSAQRAVGTGHVLRALMWCTVCRRPPDLIADLALAVHRDMMLAIPWSDWYRCLRPVLDQARECVDLRRRRALIDALGEVCFRLYRHAEAIPLTEESLALAEAAHDDRQRMLDYLRLAELYLITGDAPAALAYAGEAADLATVVRDPALHADAMINASRALIEQGQAEQANLYLGTALDLARQAQSLPYEAKALNFLGHVSRAGGRWDEALAYFRQGIAVAEAYGEEMARGVILSNIGGCLTALGRWAEAQSTLEEALAIAHAHGNLPRVTIIEQRLAALREAVSSKQ